MSSTKQDSSKAPAGGAVSVFGPELAKGEKLLWQSRAGAGAYALAHMRAVLMGMTFFVAAIAWYAYAARIEGFPEVRHAAWLFGAVGTVFLMQPVWAYVAARWFVFYALTNKRLLILQIFPKHKLKAFPIASLKRVVRTGEHLGNGTLLIDAPGAVSINPAKPRAGFYGIKYVAKLEEAVDALQNPEAALERAKAKNAARADTLMKPTGLQRQVLAGGAGGLVPSSHGAALRAPR